MCMLTYYPDGAVPTSDVALSNGAELNNDGHGYAIVAGNRLIIRRGMNGAKLIRSFMAERAKHWRGPALFHSRISTAGAVDRSNCHPFPFGGDRRTVVAHNGVLPAAAQPGKKDRRSDTRLAADEILPRKFGHLGYGPNRIELSKWIGPQNKLVILTVNPAYSRTSYVINEKSGVWDAGVWYSNYDYQGYSYIWGAYSAGLWRVTRAACRFCGEKEEIDQGACVACGTPVESTDCHYCGQMGKIDPVTQVCGVCRSCQDCLSFIDTCTCYMPSGERRRLVSEDWDDQDEAEYAGWWSDQMIRKTAKTRVEAIRREWDEDST